MWPRPPLKFKMQWIRICSSFSGFALVMMLTNVLVLNGELSDPLYTQSYSTDCCDTTVSPRMLDERSTYCGAPLARRNSNEDYIDDDLSKIIYIGGLFPLSGTSFSRNGRIDLQAACMAIDHVNQQNFIRGHKLVMYYNDTQVT